jgi:hypoxanthine phosphoribosyltransferase
VVGIARAYPIAAQCYDLVPMPRAAKSGGVMAASANPHDDIDEILLSEEQIDARVRELGAAIDAAYPAGEPIVLVSILKGSLVFVSDLMRSIPRNVEIDLMEVSSYGGGNTESSGTVRILKDLSGSIEGRNVVIVEDIIDTGLTLNYLANYLVGRNPASVKIATLLNKPARRVVDIPVAWTGFEIPDKFVVGYGLDFGEHYRNLRYVGVLKRELYASILSEVASTE